MMTPARRASAFAAVGLLVGLALAEAGLRAADDGAFPHLNVYEADTTLGTRLRPGATQRVAFGGNPASDVRINAQGFRGADWGPPAAGEIVVVGDSQAFGLGLDEPDAISTQLAAATGRPVLNAGVPTYGPPEYLAVVERLLAERKPATVVVLVNLANDLFERDRPNRDRHKVWDGWAVRSETMPDAVWGFPGRAWLFRDSHLVFALRRALYTHHDDADLGVPSEGGLADLLPRAPAASDETASAPGTPPVQSTAPPVQSTAPPVQSTAPPVQAASGDAASGDAAAADSVAARAFLAARERRLAADELVWWLHRVEPSWTYEDVVSVEALRRQNRPGDIVYEREAEGARGITVTAELLRRAAEMKKAAVPTLRSWVDAHPTDERAPMIREELARWEASGATLDALATQTGRDAEPESPLAPWLREVHARCEAAGAELIVAALPLDVQVSPGEWAKYGQPVQDMSATFPLATDVVASARRLGARAVDLREPLAAAEPGAFLDADLHLSPKGAATVAGALAAELGRPAPIASPGGGFPAGRSRFPTVDELRLAPEVVVRGSTRNRCSTRRLREWLLVECVALESGFQELGAPDLALVDVPLESAWGKNRPSTELVLPLLPGREARAHFAWPRLEGATADPTAPWSEGRREALVVRWEGDTPRIAFEPLPAGTEVRTEDRGTCLRESYQESWANVDRGCARSFTDRCDDLVACGAGTGLTPPLCAEGEVSVGSTGWCFALCDAAHPCAAGVCTDWQGAGVCL